MQAMTLVYHEARQEARAWPLLTDIRPLDRDQAEDAKRANPRFIIERVSVVIPNQSDSRLRRAMEKGAAAAGQCLQTMGLAHDEDGVGVEFDFQTDERITDASAGLLAACALAAARVDPTRCGALPPAYAATGKVTWQGQVQGVAYLDRKLQKACEVLPPGSKILYPQEQEDELTSKFPQLLEAARQQGIRLCPVVTVEEALTQLLLDRPLYTSPHLGRLAQYPALSHLEYALTVLNNCYQQWLVACLRAAGAALATLTPDVIQRLHTLTPVDVLVLHYVYTLTLAKERAAAEDIVQTLNFPSAVIAQALKTLCTAEMLQHKGSQEGYRTTCAGAAVIAKYRDARDLYLLRALALQPGEKHRVAATAHVLHRLAISYTHAARAAAQA